MSLTKTAKGEMIFSRTQLEVGKKIHVYDKEVTITSIREYLYAARYHTENTILELGYKVIQQNNGLQLLPHSWIPLSREHRDYATLDTQPGRRK